MTWVLGCTLALGLMLVASPWMWPRTTASPARAGRSLRDRLTQAGLGEVPTAAVAVVASLLGVIASGLTLALTPIVPLALAAGVAGFAVPFAVVAWRARRRRRARAAVWPDVVDHLLSGIRSGRALPDAVVALATSGPAETRDVFARFAADYRATGSFAYSLDRVKAHFADPVADRILETLRMARDVGGGEVANVLRELASHLRADVAIRGELEARQSWVVHAARLGVAAPWVVLLMLAARPEAAAAYNSPGGFAIIVGGALVTLIAYRVMVRLGRLPEDGRWFA